MKVAQTILDWTKQLATNVDAEKAFKSLANASSGNSSFTTGTALSAFSDAATGWKTARVAVVNGSGLAEALKIGLVADDGVRSFCASIGAPIP